MATHGETEEAGHLDALNRRFARAALRYQLNVLRELSHLIGPSHDVGGALDAVVHAAASIVAGPGVPPRHAFVLHREGDVLVPVAEWSGPRGHGLGDAYVIASATTRRALFERRRTAVAELLPKPAAEKGRHARPAEPPMWAMLAPVVVGDGVYGVLGVETSRDSPHTGSQLRRLEEVAHAAGLSLANALARRRPGPDDIDGVTGVPNRQAFQHALDHLPRLDYAILVVDVQNLAAITRGDGNAGDVTLRDLARVLSGMVRRGDVIARVGNDEFAVLVPGVDEEGAAAAAERVRTAIKTVPTPVGAPSIAIGGAVGHPGSDPFEVWRAADLAARTVRSGRGNGDRPG